MVTSVEPVESTHLVDRTPVISGAQIVAGLVPSRQFERASFESYRPDGDYPSQSRAVERLQQFLARTTSTSRSGLFWHKHEDAKPGIYLDGGFGVGKTHLLAAMWHGAPSPKFFGTFIEYTALVGALGYRAAVTRLKGAAMVCIDEFELDDPGDTMMMSNLLAELADAGARIAATSNTPPNALGEGRFAAADFLREIQSLSSRFDTIRIDGLDFRRRGAVAGTVMHAPEEVDGIVTTLQQRGLRVSVDSFNRLVHHLATLHPSTYGELLNGVDVVALTNVGGFHDESDALRFAAFVDRLYAAEISLVACGGSLDDVFDEDMLSGGYQKRYLRAISRMTALTSVDGVYDLDQQRQCG